MPSDPKRVQELFLKIIELRPADWPAALDCECNGDIELRRRVEALLAAHDKPDGVLDTPAVEIAATLDSSPLESEASVLPEYSADPSPAPKHRRHPAVIAHYMPGRAPGTVIARRYTLQSKIGDGGMGEVWVAKQTEPVKRNVALKLIKTGMDSHAVLQRFEQERQALAMMDHPNIAKVLDGGMTQSGQPFFVMELVNGLPLTNFCDDAKLGIRERLELFTSICDAVQHAHQKGVIHRDLKPANILVTIVDGRGVPKVIDFGVAKATSGRLTDESLLTQFGAVVGTLEYMSPEQAGFSGEDIDTRADIYSLGVILYELLTGLRPIDAERLKKAAFTEMIRIIKEEEPSKPSTRLSSDGSAPSVAALRQTEPKKLRSLLRRDLDWVVLKCLEKQRDRRYATANGLARDIQRYLSNEPVEARPPSAGYRLRKFLRRRRGMVIAASLLLFALIAGIAGTSWGLFQARRQADELKHRLGVSNMVLASVAFENRDVILADEYLDKVPAEQRGWEWHYLKQQTRGGLFTLYGHTAPVTSVAFSADGTRIVSGGGDQNKLFEVKVWNARTGRLILELEGLPVLNGINTPIVNVSFSRDGNRIVTAGGETRATVWDARTGKALLELNEEKSISAAFSPDGTRIVTGGADGSLKVWDAEKGGPAQIELKGNTNYVNSVTYSPDGTRIVSCCWDGTVKVWDAEKGGRALFEVKDAHTTMSAAFSPDGKRIVIGRSDGTALFVDSLTGTTLGELKHRTNSAQAAIVGWGGVLCAAFSPDGGRIVTGGGAGRFGEARVWDARTGAAIVELIGHDMMVMSASFSPDGARVVTGGADHTVKVWDANVGTSQIQLKGHDIAVNSAAFSGDGMLAVTGGYNAKTKKSQARVWDARTGVPLIELQEVKGAVKSVAISPDGKRIVSGGTRSGESGEATVWDAQNGTPLLELKGLNRGVYSVAFSPDGTRIVTGGGTESFGGFELDEAEVKVWDAQLGTKLLDLKGHTRIVNSVAFSADGKRIVTGGGLLGGEAVKVWDARTGTELFDVKGVPNWVMSVAFSHDGTRIVTGSSDSTVNVWDAHTGELLLDLKGHTGEVSGVSFSPDGTRIVSGGGDGLVKVWDARTGTTLVELRGHMGYITSASFSPDGTRIIAAGRSEPGKPGQAKVWCARTLLVPRELKGHTDWITNASFSPDGTQIVTSSHDQTVKVWDTKTGTIRLDLKGHADNVQCVAFSPDGTRIVSADGSIAKLWNAKTGRALRDLKGHAGAVKTVAFSPDGARIVTGGYEMDETTETAGEATVWDAQTGAALRELKGITSPVMSIAFSVDGTRIVTYCTDNTKVWDAATGLELPDEEIPKTVPNEPSSSDGRFFATLKGNHVELISLELDEYELAYRLLNTEPNLWHYREGYTAARAAKDDFAANFYLNLLPQDERKEIEAQAN